MWKSILLVLCNLLWAHVDGVTTHTTHELRGDHRGGAVAAELTNSCPFDCNGNGVCISGVCQCDTGSLGLDCHLDSVELKPGMNFYWTYSKTGNQLDATIELDGVQGWAGVGFRSDICQDGLYMYGSNFIIGEVMSDGSSIEMHEAHTPPDSMLIHRPLTNEVNYLSWWGGEVSSGRSVYRFRRPMTDFFGLDISHTIYMIYAHGEDGRTSFDMHTLASNDRGGTIAVDLTVNQPPEPSDLIPCATQCTAGFCTHAGLKPTCACDSHGLPVCNANGGKGGFCAVDCSPIGGSSCVSPLCTAQQTPTCQCTFSGEWASVCRCD